MAESRTCTYNNGRDPLTFTTSVISAYPLFDVILGTAISLVTLLLMTKLPKVTRTGRPLKQVAAADEVIVLPVSAKHGFSYKSSCVGVAPIIALPYNCSGTTFRQGAAAITKAPLSQIVNLETSNHYE